MRVHQSPSAKLRNRHNARKETAVQYKEILVFIQTKLYALRKLNFARHLTFHSVYTLGVLMWGLFGALLLTQTDGFFFVDAFMLSVSAFCEAGLATVSMIVVSRDSFIVIAVLVFFGNAIMMLIYPLVARTYYLHRVLKNITAVDKAVLDEYKLWNDGTKIFICVLFLYMVISIAVGIVVLYLALQLNPIEPEMQQRGFSPLAIAAFHSLSAFANAGFALSTSQVEYYQNNPLFYTTLSVLILLGNTASPIVLRGCMTGLHAAMVATKHRLRVPTKYIHSVKYVLDNPRRVTTNLFSSKETNFLGYVLVAINMIQYVLYLASTLDREEALEEDTKSTIAAIGTFQTICTRTAGFQIVPLRNVNQGMLVVYALAMYLSAAPFLSTMYLTQDNVEQVSQLTTIGDLDSSDESDDDGDDRFRPPVLKRTEPKSIAHNIKTNFMTKHIYYLLCALVLLAFTEDGILSKRPEDVNLWYVLFEVASAYGTVGLSLGMPGHGYSLVGAFSPAGKLIITAVIFLGKHRGLPLPTDAVIDFKFNRLKRASRRKAKASLKMQERPKSMLQNVLESVQQTVESITPRTPRKKKVESKGIAILELKPREKRKTEALRAESIPTEGVSPSAGQQKLKREGSYHDVNPNLPLIQLDPNQERRLTLPIDSGGASDKSPSRRRVRTEGPEEAMGTGISPVDKLLSHIGVLAPQEESATPFVYSPRLHRRRSEVGRDRVTGGDAGDHPRCALSPKDLSRVAPMPEPEVHEDSHRPMTREASNDAMRAPLDHLPAVEALQIESSEKSVMKVESYEVT